MLEVEMKFRLADQERLANQLEALGASAGQAVHQSDLYFNHPGRDFAVTDEALRLRTIGQQSVVTYKGPKLAGPAKSRFELEIPLAPTTEGEWSELLEKLGFVRVATVRKERKPWSITFARRQFEIVIDQVEGLGHFAEVETVAEESDRKPAATAVAQLAEKLGLTQGVNLSYLEMLLQSEG